MADHPGPLDGEIRGEIDRLSLPDAEQLELIRDQVPGRDAATAVAVYRSQPRRPGRPPGARNKRNQKFRDYILHQHGHPGDILGRTWNRPVELLAAELGCSLHEAKLLQIRAAAELLPYIEGKQPTQIEMRSTVDGILIMGGAPGVTGPQLEAIAREVEEGEELGIDWQSVEFEELPEPLRNGEPLRDGPASDGGKSEGQG